MKQVLLSAIMSTILCCGLWGCSAFVFLDNNSNENELVSGMATADRSVLTERQKKILADESLPTEIDELTSKQLNGIMAIENALLYLDEKYKGVEFEYLSHRMTGIMGNEKTNFVPVGYDKEDERNIVTVKVESKGGVNVYSDNDDYMLVIVKEATEKIITEYVENYFGKDNVKVYVYPYWTDLQYGDEISEKIVIGRVKSTAVLFVPDDKCSEAQLDKFSEKYKNDNHGFDCQFRATIVSREDFDGLTFENHGDLYYPDHIIYDIDIE